ncbi:MarR family winged helix-turn-helix transcriptional regulator [Vibrio sp.]|uniref:MarR family winged helix-turn-helix transcriptional regulator n=1 Tax=Vibrio sp. TaxID=678 RepID=UPI003D0BBA72
MTGQSVECGSDTPELLLENQVCFPLYSAANAMIRGYRPLLDALDLTYLQYLVMMVLWRHDGISVKELGNKLYLDSGTLTPLLKRLEGKGLVERLRSAEDERVRILKLTSEGKALQQQAKHIPEAMKCQSGMSLDDLVALKQLCEKLLKNLGN